MKRHIFFFAFIFLPTIIFSQPNITKITWVGTNNEYMNFTKKSASLQKGNEFQKLTVVKYVKNNYILLSRLSFGVEMQEKYNIVSFTKDTLILAPDGYDILSLSEPNKLNQYVFANSMLIYKFERLYYETPINNHEGEKISVGLYIDSAKNSKIVLKDGISNKTKTYKSTIDKKDYERLIRILSSCNISYYKDVDNTIDIKNCRRRVLEIKFNNQIKTFKGCDDTLQIPACYSELNALLIEYIALKASIDIKSERKKVKK